MHTWCEISQKALRANYTLFRGFLGESSVAPVLKSNAYGHGFKETYEALSPLNPPILCVNYSFEAELLRKFGYKNRILLVGPGFESDLKACFELKAELVIGGEDLFGKWLTAKNKCKVHLKFDTGLSRQGLYCEKAKEYCEKIKPFSEYLQGVTTHFANVEDVTGQNYAELQLKLFLRVHKIFREFLGIPYELHASASAPSLLLKEARFDFCRIGISLYGFSGKEKLKAHINTHLRPKSTF